MENKKRPQSVEDIIRKYGVQSISTEAANDIMNEDSFSKPPEKPAGRCAEHKNLAEEKKPKKKFTVNIPEEELFSTQELPDDFDEQVQTAYMREAEEAASAQAAEESNYLPEEYADLSDSPELSEVPELQDMSDSYFIPDTAYYTGIFAENGEPVVHEVPQTLEGVESEDERDRYFIDRADGEKTNFFVRFLKFLFPWKGDRTSEIIRKIIFLVALIVLIISGSVLVSNKLEDLRAGRNDADIAALHNGDANVEEAEKLFGGPLPDGILPEFAMLYAQNQDVVGWLHVEGTDLDYPIARAQDNDYYFHRNYYKEETRYGVPFMDYRCGYNPLDENTVIYGHHMNNGTVFSSLDAYKTLDGYKKHPIINFDTLYERHEWQVFGAFITNAYKSDDDGYTFNYMINSFADENDFNGFVDAVKKRSVFTTDVEVTYGDKLLTLQTCSHEFGDARLVVVARMVMPGDPEVDVNAAAENPNPIYPLAYCKKFGLPYNVKPEDRWYPANESAQGSETQDETTEEVTTAPTTATTTAPSTTLPTTTATATTKPTTTTTTSSATTTTRPTTTTKPTTTTTTEPQTEVEVTDAPPVEPPIEVEE